MSNKSAGAVVGTSMVMYSTFELMKQALSDHSQKFKKTQVQDDEPNVNVGFENGMMLVSKARLKGTAEETLNVKEVAHELSELGNEY